MGAKKPSNKTSQRISWDALFDAARRARSHAYAPYSKFGVGAAVLGDDGAVYAGCNVENASYGLSVCAERHAVAELVKNGGRKVRAVAILTAASDPTPPCGACRQVLAEFGAPSVPVIMRNTAGDALKRTLGELLPDAFTQDML